MYVEAKSAEEERKERIITKMIREMGTTCYTALQDPEIIEIMLNPDGEIWFDRLGQGQSFSGEKMKVEYSHAFLGTVASYLGVQLHNEKPILEGELPIDGSRIEGTLPPITSQPGFTIRKKASKIFTLNEYLQDGRISDRDAEIIRNAICDRKNILIAGATGSGKTTLTNAILHEIGLLCPHDRIVLMEDTLELQCSHKNQYPMRTSLTVDMRMLLKTTMRLRPDRIVIGEVRGAEALDLLKSWNTGHPGGVTTIHANSSIEALSRLEMLIQEAIEIPMQRLIAKAVGLCIFIQRLARRGPHVTEIMEVKDWSKENSYSVEYLKKSEEV